MRLIQYYPATRSLSPAFGLVGRSPWTGLEDEIDRLVTGALSGFSVPTPASQFAVDLYEDNDNAYVRAELPGVKRDDIKVEMVEGSLNISATRKQKTDRNEETLSYSRSISVPGVVQADKVSASYENGVLQVTLPKREEAKPKKVSVAVN
jgi:HSP20 family protein